MKSVDWLRALVLTALLLLVVQYVLGLLVMAYSPMTWPVPDSYLDTHYAVGLLVAFVALIVLIVSAMTRRVPFVAASLVAFIAILIADQAGATFWRGNGENEVYSITMGITFLIAFSSYLWEALAVSRAVMPKPAVS